MKLPWMIWVTILQDMIKDFWFNYKKIEQLEYYAVYLVR